MAPVVKALLDAVGRGLEGPVHVALGDLEVEHHVVVGVLVNLHRIRLQGRFRVHHRRKRLVVHGDAVQGVLGPVPVLGHHHGHGLAHVVNLAEGQHPRPRALEHGLDRIEPWRRVELEAGREGRDGVPDVLAREDPHDPRHCQSRAHVNA